MTDPHDTRAIAALRADVTHYRGLFTALYAVACGYLERVSTLERQLAETRAELARYTRERVA